MRDRPSTLISRLAVLLLAAVTAASCMGGAAPSARPPASEPTATHNQPTPEQSPAGAGQTPGDQFAAIEGAHLLVRTSRDSEPAASAEDVAALARANTEFALDVYRSLAAPPEGNIILGPHSISTALAMIYAGARGETAAEMAEVLHFDGVTGDLWQSINALDLALASRSQEGVVDLRLANQVFAKPGLPLLDDYLVTLGRDFGAPLAELDFLESERARQVINDWAKDRTNGRITDLFPTGSITPATVLVVVNAVAMDAAWRYRFDAAHTRTEPFHLGDGSVVDVPMMHFDLYMPLVDGPDYYAVELPYGRGDLSMVVILPDDIESFTQGLDVERLHAIFGGIAEQGIHLSLPKFSFKLHTPLDEILQGLGMKSVYGSDADLSGMTGSRDLFLDTVQHEAFIEVDEKGTEAHAATGGSVAASHGPTITFDRPFLFVIRDRVTGAILFLGRVTDPRG